MKTLSPTERAVFQATARLVYRRERDEFNRLAVLEDAAFARYWKKLQAGEPTNGAAVSRAANRANEQSTKLYSAQANLYRLGLDPWDIDDADGVERTTV